MSLPVSLRYLISARILYGREGFSAHACLVGTVFHVNILLMTSRMKLCLHFATPAWSKEYRLLECMVDPEPKIDRGFLNVKADVPGFDIAGLSHCLSRTRSAQVRLQASSRILSLTSIARWILLAHL